MKNRISINIGFSFTHYNKNENDFESIPTFQGIGNLLQGLEFDRQEIKCWIDELVKGFYSDNIILIVPNTAYENKTILNEIFFFFETQKHIETFKIISECEAIASYLISNHEKDSDYRAIDFGQTTINVHDFTLTNGIFYHSMSKNIQLTNKKTVANLLGKENDPVFNQQDDNVFYELLNTKYDNFKNNLNEDLDYPLKKESQILYEDLKNVFERLGKQYSEKLASEGFVNTNNTKYCGGQSGLFLFMHYAANSAESIIDFRYCKVIGGMKWDTKMYPTTKRNIVLKIFTPKEEYILLLPSDYKTNSESIQYLGGYPENERMNVSIFDTEGTNSTIKFEYGDKILKYTINELCINSLKTIPLIGNNKYRWRKVEFAVSIDGCQNLVVHFGHNSKIIYSNIVDKI